jgi:hypothetical protein
VDSGSTGYEEFSDLLALSTGFSLAASDRLASDGSCGDDWNISCTSFEVVSEIGGGTCSFDARRFGSSAWTGFTAD